MRKLPNQLGQSHLDFRFVPSEADARAMGGLPVSRRDFLKMVGMGAMAVGAGLFLPRRALANGGSCVGPNPIPGGIHPFGPGTTLFHVYVPAHPGLGNGDPAIQDPSLITDFNGHVGLAYVDGMGTRTDKNTGEERHLPFEVDLRFMKGVYVGVDDEEHHGAFALI